MRVSVSIACYSSWPLAPTSSSARMRSVRSLSAPPSGSCSAPGTGGTPLACGKCRWYSTTPIEYMSEAGDAAWPA